MVTAILVGMVGLANGQVELNKEVVFQSADMKIVEVEGQWLGSRDIQIVEMRQKGSKDASSFIVQIYEQAGSFSKYVFDVTKISRNRCGGTVYETAFRHHGPRNTRVISLQISHQAYYGCGDAKGASWKATLTFRGCFGGSALKLEGEPFPVRYHRGFEGGLEADQE